MTRYWANRKTKVVHDARTKSQQCCAEWISATRLIRFSSLSQAVSDGYRLCRRCFKGADAGNGLKG